MEWQSVRGSKKTSESSRDVRGAAIFFYFFFFYSEHILGSFRLSELISDEAARNPTFPPLWASFQRSDAKRRGSKLITDVSEAS